MESKVLEALSMTLPMMQEIFGLDVQICLCDREKTIGVWYGKTFRMDIKVGQYLDPANPAHRTMIGAMESGKGSVSTLPAQVYGVPVTGIITPVKEDGEVVGVISSAVCIANNIKIQESADNLNSNLSSTYASSREISEGVTQLANKMESVKDHSVTIRNLVQETTEILKNIQSNSNRSNILALNASIEAARVGEAGRGFTVVASEMGKLAKMSGEATNAISDKLNDTFQQLDNIADEITTVANISSEQAANIEEVSARLKAIEEDANMLAQAAKISR